MTKRQDEVLLWVQRGLSNKQIAGRLKIAETTVKIHVSALLKKNAVRTRAQLIVYTESSKAIDLAPLEQQPIGWVKKAGASFSGISFTKKAPDDTWLPIYLKET